MQAWEQIQIAVDYIDEHLGEQIAIDELSRMASLSPFYFQRLFARLTKKPVGEYIKLRRLAKSLKLLSQDGARILDVALALGFSSHALFTRAFKEAFGLTPSEYKNHPVALNRMTKPELSLSFANADEGVPLITDGIVLEINIRTLASPILFAGVQTDAPLSFMSGLGTESGADPLVDTWDVFHKNKAQKFGIDEAAEEIGVTFASDKPGCFAYYAGGRADALTGGAEGWTLMPGQYAVCAFEAADFDALVMDALYKAQQYLYQWLTKRNLATEPFCAERYASHTPETTGMEVWLKLK